MVRFGYYLFGIAFTVSAQQSAPPEPFAWQIESQQFIAPPGASRPTPSKTASSSKLIGTDPRSVSVIFEISEQGVPFNIRVEHTSDAESADEVIALIRQWRFEAASNDGIPVASKGYIDLSLNQAALPLDAIRPKLKAALKP